MGMPGSSSPKTAMSTSSIVQFRITILTRQDGQDSDTQWRRVVVATTMCRLATGLAVVGRARSPRRSPHLEVPDEELEHRQVDEGEAVQGLWANRHQVGSRLAGRRQGRGSSGSVCDTVLKILT